MSTEKKLQHIVIVGGGFAGFLLAKRINPEKFRVTLVDRKNFHAFPPLFYQEPFLTLQADYNSSVSLTEVSLGYSV